MKNKNNFKKEEIVEVTEEVVEAVANAIVEEAKEQGKEVVEIVEEIIDEAEEQEKEVVEEAEEQGKEVVEEAEEIIDEEVTEEIIDEEVTEENIKEVIETVKPGFVSGCVKLNVRKEANTDAEVVCTIDENTEVVVDKNASTEDFYKVITAAGIEGFCMSKYITIK